jgi:hypothetical protein
MNSEYSSVNADEGVNSMVFEPARINFEATRVRAGYLSRLGFNTPGELMKKIPHTIPQTLRKSFHELNDLQDDLPDIEQQQQQRQQAEPQPPKNTSKCCPR